MANNKKERFTNYSTLTRTYETNAGERQDKAFVVIEGNLTRDPELKAGKSTSYLFNAIGTSVSAEEVFARANNTYDKKKSYDSNSFFNLKFFGRNAERIAKIGKKGMKLIIWGDIEKEEYTDSSGNDRISIGINVENFVAIFGGGDYGDDKKSSKSNKKESKPKEKVEDEEIDDEELSTDFLEDDDDDLPF
jgi:single stranded DNA-binding protein